ncbi:MAG TPA: DUF4832 domain-containing protein [Cytophagaceae bacterium]|nr:DUF4832 domain-containing protein [Cytophagaceae bacterium]
MKGNALFIFFILLVLRFTASYGQTEEWAAQQYNPNVPKIEDNPLKGLIPAFNEAINSFPHSMEYFYIPLNEVMKGMNKFEWDLFESELNRVSSQGNQAVFRFYIDYPGRPSAIPQFLIDGGLKTHNYLDFGNNEISLAPNWKDSTLIKALENFVTALGAKYNGDPRIGYITLGLYGFWGEWHNWPHNNWNMPTPYKERLIAAFIKSFPDTQIQLRDPLATSNSVIQNSLGYHDDSFCQSTIGPETWHFWLKMKDGKLTENWKTYPMGGEIYPEMDINAFWESWPNTVGQDWETCVRTTHATWFMNQALFRNMSLTSAEYTNALRATKMLGYEFFVSSVKLSNTVSGNPLINAEVKIQNKGVAPIYYNWKIELAVLAKKTVISLGTADWNINKILPDSIEYLRSISSSHALAPGIYTLVMRVVNPLEKINKKAKQLRFANAKQDIDKKGWLTLGTIEVKP